MANAYRDENSVPTLIAASNADGFTPVRVYADPTTHRLLVDLGGGGTGTVTSVSVVSANGFAGTVATATTTPAITLTTTVTGIVKGNGTAISAATAGTDYTALAFKTIAVAGQSDVVADTAADTLTLVASTGMTITTDAATDTITFASSGGTAADIQVGVTTVSSGTTTRILYDNAGVLGEYTLTGTGTVVAMQTAPVFVTNITTPAVLATANDSGALGASGTAFSDLFLAEGGVINWDAGDATITQTNNVIAVAGITDLTVSGNVEPASNDGGALGKATTNEWSDLFLAEGGVINWDNGDATITQAGNVVTLAGADLVVPNLTDSALTAGRVTFAGASGLLADDSDLTFSGSTLTATNIAATTFTGNITLAEGVSVALDPVLSADGTYTGTTISGTANETLAFGDCIYLLSTGKWGLADADAASTAGSVMVGFCVLAAAAQNDPTVILLDGNIRADTAFPTFTVGVPVYISPTAGDVTATQPSSTDQVIRVVGFALTADSIFVKISPDYITHT